MTNSYYNGGNVPAPNSPGASVAIRNEFTLVTQAFDKLPTIAGNANKVVVVNSSATGLEATSTPNLGTPSSLVLTYATGLPLTTGVVGILPVAFGGSGVGTLTGYVKGSGTSPFTASPTIPNSDITGLGSMSTQNANTVSISGGSVSNTSISGGSINNTPVGASTPDTGAFTSLSANTASINSLTATSGTVGGDTIVTTTATQTLTGKTIDLASNTFVATSAQLASAVTDETGSGSLVFANSPVFAGTPTAPTAALGTNTQQLATTAFVQTAAFTAILPGQAGNQFKFVTTDGTTASWSLVPLTTGVSGVLPPANGGTGLSSPGANGNVLTSNGTAWVSSALVTGAESFLLINAGVS